MTRRQLLLLAAAAFPAAAQEFDAATVKPNNSASGMSGFETVHGRFTGTNNPLKSYIRIAWDLREYQILGPAWIDSDRFDINATGPDAPGTARARLRALIEQRFRLHYHRENRPMSVYHMDIATGGFKLKPLEGEPNGTTNNGRGDLYVSRADIARFTEVLSRQTDYPVIDRTGLTGIYDFNLKWTPDEQRAATDDPSAPPSLQIALREQLGLRLQPAKAPVEMFVVDSASRNPIET
jgi:uncharacterized protein (TIGR03435 family)